MSKNENNQFLVAGLGIFGRNVAKNLEALGCDVIAIDSNEKVVQDLSRELTYVVCGDASDEKNIKALGGESIGTAIITMKDLQSSVLCTLILKECGVERIVVKATDYNHGKILEKIGATRIVYSERETAKRIAHSLYSTEMVDYMELPNDTGFMTVKVPANIVGKNLIESNLRQLYNINVASIIRDGKPMVNPNPHEVLQSSDQLMLFGDNSSLQDFRKSFL